MSKYYYRDGTYLYIGFNYNPMYVEKMKEFGFLYNPANKEWYTEPDLSFINLINEFIKSEGFEKGKPKEDLSKLVLPEHEETFTLDEVEGFINGIGLKRQPRNYQVEGIHYMLNHINCVNASDTGTGKSGMTVVTMELLDSFPIIIVSPASVKMGWKREWYQWVDGRKIQVLDSKSVIEKGNEVYVVNYDILDKRLKDLLKIKPKCAIFDEIHLCKNATSKRSKAAKKLANKCQFVYGLSGTFILNRVTEVMQPLRILNQFKELFPDLQYFYNRYCNAKRTRFGLNTSGASNTLELNKVLSNKCYFRKEKKDVLTELPPLIETTYDIPISNYNKYYKAEREFIEFLKQNDIDKVKAAQRAEQLVKMAYLKGLSIEGKTEGIKSFIKDWLECNEGKKLLVFGVRTKPLEELNKSFPSHLIKGGLSAQKKSDIIESFREDDKMILFANIDTIGTGVDGLQKICEDLLYIELPNRPSDIEQANARLLRMGSIAKESINVGYLLSPETIDMQIQSALSDKKSVTDAVNKGLCAEADEAFNLMVMKKLIEKSC